MNKKENKVIVFVCLIVFFAILHTILLFQIHLDDIALNIQDDSKKVIYLMAVIEKYAYYSMIWVALLTAAFVFMIIDRNKSG
jgi:H+/Cl- antiporter ClcA